MDQCSACQPLCILRLCATPHPHPHPHSSQAQGLGSVWTSALCSLAPGAGLGGDVSTLSVVASPLAAVGKPHRQGAGRGSHGDPWDRMSLSLARGPQAHSSYSPELLPLLCL